MIDSSFKPSLSLESLLSGDIAGDSERFLLFMKAYYEWMQSCRIEISNLDGVFVRGETVIGASSGASGTITEVGTGYIILKVIGNNPGDQNEIFTGQTSGATANASRIKDNVVRKSGNVLDYRNIETSIDEYVNYLKEELYPSIPLDYYGDKRLLATKFKGFFQSKSNEESYRFLFKLLYNEEIDFYYPGEDLLRVSDGNFERTEIIRVTSDAYGIDALGVPYAKNIFEFLNKTIEGQTSGYLANVVDIKKFFIGSVEVAEFTLKLVSGTFVGGETIVDVDDANLLATTYGIISRFNIIDGGSGYAIGDIIELSGDGSEAEARVSSIKESPISALSINATGYGYRLNTLATVDNTGTGGSGLIIKVTGIEDTHQVTYSGNTYTFGEISDISVISRGEGYFKTPSITLQDTIIKSIGMLYGDLVTIQSGGTNYGVGNTLNITGGSGTSAAGIVASVQETVTYDFLFEDGMRMSLEGGSQEDILKNQDWNVLGPITRIEFTNYGTGYTTGNLPTITVNSTTGANANVYITSVLGESANVTVDVANNVAGIGSIRAVEITNFGIDYTTATANVSLSGDGNANLTPIIAGLGTKEGTWIDDDGKIDYKYIQDSYFYQDFSYVIKSGLGFGFYKDTLKKIIHPAGLQLFGEILIRDIIDLTPDIVTDIEILRDFERMIIQIFSAFAVGAEYEYSRISWSIKVEPPVADTSVVKPEVQEYVIFLVPEGDDLNGVTDVSTILPQENLDIGKMHIEIAPISSATADVIAPPSLKKMYVTKTDILEGYSGATYGDLPMTPRGVYGDFWADVQISAIASNRFSDEYYEVPANQAVYTITIDNVFDVLVSTQTNLKYTLQKLSGNITTVDCIVTMESLVPTVSPVPINLYADITNEVFKEMQIEYAPQESNLQIDTGEEYVLHVYASGFQYRTFSEIPLSEYGSNTILELSGITFENYYDLTQGGLTIPVSPSPLTVGQHSGSEQPQDVFRTRYKYEIVHELDVAMTPYWSDILAGYTTVSTELDREIPITIQVDVTTSISKEYNVVIAQTATFVDATVVFSSATPQKQKSAEGVVSAYGIKMEDLELQEIAGLTFSGTTAEVQYQNLETTLANTTFSAFYRTFPKSQTEMVYKTITINDASQELSANREIVVRAEGHGFRFKTYQEATFAQFGTDAISTLSDVTFEQYLDTVYDATIKASPSPFISGQSSSGQPTDIFRGEYQVKSQNDPSAYNTLYDNVKVGAFQTFTFTDNIPGTEDIISEQTFGLVYPQAPQSSTDYIKYTKIAGTVSSATQDYSTFTLTNYAEVPIGDVDDTIFSNAAPVVVGSGTDFQTDYNIYDVFVANNEYFTVEAIANTTHMVVDRQPASGYSGVNAYKVVN